MTFEQIKPEDIPIKVKALQHNIAIYEAVKKLARSGVGSAIRVKIDDTMPKRIRLTAHVYFRHRPIRLRTKKVDGYMYFWIENRTPERFEPAAVPEGKMAERRA